MRSKPWLLAALTLMLGAIALVNAQPAAAQAAGDPFVTTITVDAVTNFNYTSVSIPAKKRLVIDYISLSGAAQSVVNNQVEPIQPIVILNATVAGGTQNLFYFAPQQNNQLSTQFYMAQPTTIYADTLLVGPAFAGFAPTFDTFNVVISGHLVAQ
jgi:hypothetical protein